MRFVRLAGAYTIYNGNFRRLVPAFSKFSSQPTQRSCVTAKARHRPLLLASPTLTGCRAAPGGYHGEEVMRRVLAYAP